MIALLDELGPRLGVPTLRTLFPPMARAELADLVQRYRRLWRQRHQQPLCVLHWQVPGTVWAMDFAEAPIPIDGIYPYLLAARDLASGAQLLWQLLREPTAAEARNVRLADYTDLTAEQLRERRGRAMLALAMNCWRCRGYSRRSTTISRCAMVVRSLRERTCLADARTRSNTAAR